MGLVAERKNAMERSVEARRRHPPGRLRGEAVEFSKALANAPNIANVAPLWLK